MYIGRTIEQALEQTVLSAKGQTAATRPPAIFWQDLFIEEGIYSYDLITTGLCPGTTDSHRAQYVAKRRDKIAQKKGDHHSHSADHEWSVQRGADAEMKRYAFHSLSVVYDPKRRKFLRQVKWYEARLTRARGDQRYDMNQGIKDQRCFLFLIRSAMRSGLSLQWPLGAPGGPLDGPKSPITLLTFGTGLWLILSAPCV